MAREGMCAGLRVCILFFIFHISNNVSGAQGDCGMLIQCCAATCLHVCVSECVLDRYCFKERGEPQGVGELEQ